MKIIKMIKWSLLTVLFFCCTLGLAGSPTVMLQNVADQMLGKLQENKGNLNNNQPLIRRILTTVLVPHIDANRMAGMVVGRQYWYSASPAQRRQFVDQFQRVVINTYSSALASYDDDKVKIYPLRSDESNQRIVHVQSMVVRKSGQKIPISYNLIQSAGNWKIYDFSIAGVSIVQNYRSQFSSALSEGGLPVLLARLEQHNQRQQ